jgi:phosphomannomutase
MKIKLVMFDLDDTLAESKCPLAPDMAEALHRLLRTRYVSVISGCKWEQFLRQFVRYIEPEHYRNLIVAPVSGGQVYRWRNEAWQLVNSTSIGISFDQIVAAFEASFDACGFERPTRLWGPQFEDRICQVTFSALGQEAPHDVKKTWDPDFSKRKPLIEDLQRRLPDYLSIRAGGSTSIDVSGFEKDYGIRQVTLQMKKEGLTEDDLLFIGDAIFPGGNDYAVTKTNVRYRSTESLTHTRRLIEQILSDEDAVLAESGRGVPPTD